MITEGVGLRRLGVRRNPTEELRKLSLTPQWAMGEANMMHLALPQSMNYGMSLQRSWFSHSLSC